MYVHSNHIPQPPHSAGLRYQGLRPRIDASQVPSPIEIVEEDRLKWEDRAYGTLPGSYVPASTSDFIAIDQGNSSPKFARVTTWKFPSSSRLASECQIPLAAVFQPFAELDPVEEPVPLVHTGESGPARCGRCRALDANLMRLDHLQRPELNKGTVDFVVPKEYWAINPPEGITLPYYTVTPPSTGPRPPEPMKYIFAFDVSYDAVQSEFLSSACACVLRILFGGTTADGASIDACFPPESSVAFITYDQTIHFYDISSDLAPMLVVPDLEEVFVPLQRGLFINPIQRRDTVESFLSALPGRFQHASMPDVALGSLLRSCLASLAGHGGHVLVFSSAIPTIGIGQLKGQPNESELFDTDKERVMYKPRDEAWTEIGQDCALDGIAVTMVLAPHKYMDIGSIGAYLLQH
ncbi:hypothetical protein H0H87_011927 [Tephrocybe sp. NHM501043]|nr:hypothetical protein H0H87_011927 [Tephrocybe sp. NHM501043]